MTTRGPLDLYLSLGPDQPVGDREPGGAEPDHHPLRRRSAVAVASAFGNIDITEANGVYTIEVGRLDDATHEGLSKSFAQRMSRTRTSSSSPARTAAS